MDPILFNAILFGGIGLLFGLELRSKTFRAATLVRSARAARNWSFLAGAILSAVLLRQISRAFDQAIDPWIDPFAHPVVDLIGCFIVAELVSYVLHWVKHRSAFLWRFHFSHHLETDYNVWLTTHTHALEVVISGSILALALVVLGFSPLSIQCYLLFNGIANTYQHSTFDYSLGPLDHVIVSPAYHRFHHAVGSDVNFGDTLTIWDAVFRTAKWPESRRAPDVLLGIEPSGEPYGFWKEMRWFLAR
jgi:sterol desaturase/sphingolipid hydroxylase (fatty acid hydroxylase superfamily)